MFKMNTVQECQEICKYLGYQTSNNGGSKKHLL